MAWASTVAVVVPSPATSEVLLATSRTICAPMFSSVSFSSISLATVTPSLVMVGEPNFFSMTTLRPLGPRVTFTASARTFTPRRIACRDSSPCTICLAICFNLLFDLFQAAGISPALKTQNQKLAPCCRVLALAFLRFGRAAQRSQHLFLANDDEIFAIDLDLGAGVLAEQNAVARLHIERRHFAVFLDAALTDGNHFALLRLFFRSVRDDDAATYRLLLFHAPDQDPVMQWGQLRHELSSYRIGVVC